MKYVAGYEISCRFIPEIFIFTGSLILVIFQVLESMGQHPTEEELFSMISEVDENASGSIGM